MAITLFVVSLFFVFKHQFFSQIFVAATMEVGNALADEFIGGGIIEEG